ncbi:MAG: nucleotidyltransferase family protein, partial [Bryobacteraceae bacterium]
MAGCSPVVWDTNTIRTTRILRYGVALLEALQFRGSQPKLLRALDETEWRGLLALCDASQLTLLFGHLCRPDLPDWVRNRIDRNYLDNSYRFERLKAATLEIADLLTQRSIDFTLLKGFAHSPDLTPDPRLRTQGDIDLWCLPDQILSAKDALLDLHYRPIAASKSRHLDPMMRDTEWEWRGDYFARDLPIPVDLHYKLWDEEMERIPGPEEDRVWNRRCSLSRVDTVLPVLEPADAVAFAALHVMMHLLHGDVRLQRVWELAYVLHTREMDEPFWSRWQSLHPAPTRRVQTVAFLLADYWFACGFPEAIREEAETLSPDVVLWVRHYGLSPIEALFVPNKSELWLNLCLVDSFTDKARVLSRRLLPIGAAKPRIEAESRQEEHKSNKAVFRSAILKRASHHARTLPVSCAQGMRWWWLRQGLGSEFFKFLLSSVLFDFGEFIFFLLYNLYLLDRGFKEAFLGEVAAAVTAGTFVAVLPAAALTRRIGLRNAVLLAIAGTAAATTLRA